MAMAGVQVQRRLKWWIVGAACACGVVEKPPKKRKTKVGEAKRVRVFWLFIYLF